MSSRGTVSVGSDFALATARSREEESPTTSPRGLPPMRPSVDPRTTLLDRMSMLVLTVDAAGNVVYANASALRALGSEAESPVGLPISLVAPDLTGTSWSAFLATVRAAGVITTDTLLRAADGHPLPAEV